MLTFERCAAYAADQDEDSTTVGWAESYDSADGARQRALSECGSRGGSGCMVRVWGCNGHVVEEGLGLDRASRREIQAGLQAQGFDPGGADGMFGPRTRAAIRSWQSSQGARATGYLDGASVAGLRPSVAGQTTFRPRETAGRRGSVGARLGCAVCRLPGAAAAVAVGHRGAGEPVLAVDREQHEPGRVRGVSGAVPERGVPCAGGGPSGGAAVRRPAMRRRRRVGRPAGSARGSPVLGRPALAARRSGRWLAATRRVVLATFSGTATSVRRWWCCLTAVWRWAATR